jgi:hypothetical protein
MFSHKGEEYMKIPGEGPQIDQESVQSSKTPQTSDGMGKFGGQSVSQGTGKLSHTTSQIKPNTGERSVAAAGPQAKPPST